MSAVPPDLKWVEIRAACTVANVFNQLCDGVKDDVFAINTTRGFAGENVFKADLHSSGTTIFVGQPNRLPRRRVAIGVVGDRIEVEQEWEGGLHLSASIGLNNEGRCVLKMKEAEKEIELEQWQFRKMALENLFFGDR
jgi:hypothetical protein